MPIFLDVGILSWIRRYLEIAMAYFVKCRFFKFFMVIYIGIKLDFGLSINIRELFFLFMMFESF
jgi:hypothetical protein